ncbi:MAG: GIY-YIG nuclease family protein [Mucilaginibacter sp.]|jgi:putative endonuclease
MVFQKGGSVYIMANKYNNVLYTGVSSELTIRIWQHKNNIHPNSFTAKYKCDKLVYYLNFPFIEEAIAEEKRIKGCIKEYKRQLINSINPNWIDLYESLIG